MGSNTSTSFLFRRVFSDNVYFEFVSPLAAYLNIQEMNAHQYCCTTSMGKPNLGHRHTTARHLAGLKHMTSCVCSTSVLPLPPNLVCNLGLHYLQAWVGPALKKILKRQTYRDTKRDTERNTERPTVRDTESERDTHTHRHREIQKRKRERVGKKRFSKGIQDCISILPNSPKEELSDSLGWAVGVE